jgi:hypothetical protein
MKYVQSVTSILDLAGAYETVNSHIESREDPLVLNEAVQLRLIIAIPLNQPLPLKSNTVSVFNQPRCLKRSPRPQQPSRASAASQ